MGGSTIWGTYPHIFVFAFFALISSSVSYQLNPNNVTIFVMGRSGAGISSAIYQILGPGAEIQSSPLSVTSSVTEFEISLLNCPNRFLKIVDVDGFVDGKTVTQDAQTLATLASYSNTDTNNYTPNFFLVISRIDDSRFADKESLFSQTLGRITTFKKSQFGVEANTISNNVILLTWLSSETSNIQRRPGEKVNQFKMAVANFTELPADTEIIVGENKGKDYDLQEENGFTKLPNKELYPKNILEQILKLALKLNDASGYHVIQEFINVRGNLTKYDVVKKPFELNNLDSVANNDYLSKIMSSDSENSRSEIAQALEQELESFDQNERALVTSEIIQLQSKLENLEITTRDQLAQTTLEKVALFQQLGTLNQRQYKLLNLAFGLKMPDFVQNLVVGSSYDVTQDVFGESPFIDYSVKESEIGYLIPEHIICSFLSTQNEMVFSNFTNLLKDYIRLRMDLLKFEKEERFHVGNFNGNLRRGFSISPEEGESTAQLSLVKEFQQIKCELKSEMNLKPSANFVNALASLKEYDESDRESVNEWNSFFNMYGTHIVKGAFAGGYISGAVVGPGVKRSLNSETRLKNMFEEILNLKEYSAGAEVQSSYAFYGGVKDQVLENVSRLDNNSRKQALANWSQSIKNSPIMLEYQLELLPISELAKKVNESISLEIRRVVNIYVNKKLEYKRKKTTVRPSKTGMSLKPLEPSRNFSVMAPTKPTFSPMRSYSEVTIPTRSSTPSLECPQCPIVHQCPISKCPQCPTPPPQITCPTFPPTSVPCTTPPTPLSVEKDYIGKVVGQGFHILKDIILPMSYTNKAVVDDVQPCQTTYLIRFDSFEDYVKDRINAVAETNYRFIVYDAPTSYSGKLPPGYLITPNYPDRPLEYISIYQEIKKAIASILPTDIPKILNSTSEIIKDLNNLEDLNINPSCSLKTEWRDFFSKHGTHIIVEAIKGRAEERKYFEESLNTFSNNGNNTLCVPLPTYSAKNIKKESGSILRSRFSMKLINLSVLLAYFPENLVAKYDWAYEKLILDQLNC